INMTSKIRRRVIVTGKVQGVAFRAYSRSAARQIGVVGWVRNLPNGSVETVIEGDSNSVGLMLAWLKKGSPHSKVDDMVIIEERSTGEFTDFEITFDGWESWRVR
ncbi:MAG: acylphosphatase, partial [Desulfomonilaceae bacterium]